VCGQVSSVFFSNHIQRIAWLILLAVSAVGGWYYGRPSQPQDLRMVSAVDSTGDVAGRMTVRKAKSTFSRESPRGLWMERVKKAEASDFPQLVKEWHEAFPEDERYEEYYPPNALHTLRWMMGVWLAKDPDGFLKAASSESFEHSRFAAQAMAELMPEKAAEWLSGPIGDGLDGLDRWFVGSLAGELAKNHPELYLEINPDGLIDHTPGMSNDDWEVAISSLAKNDALAAGNACLLWKVDYDPGSLYRAILAVAKAWQPSDPSISEWTGSIADPRLRNFANHAWLSALAEKDPKAALKKLYEVKLEDDNDLRESAPRVILKKLAMEYPVEALKLLKDVEGIFVKHKWDPFAEPSAEEETEISVSPFSDLNSVIHSVGAGSLEDNGVRLEILNAMADDLPDDPAALVAAIRQLSGEMSGSDPSWKLGIEAYLIRLKSQHWSFDQCMAAAVPWAAESNAMPDDSPLQELASRAAKQDPQLALAALERFPEQARSFFAGEIIKQLPSSESAQRIDLLSQLPAGQWDRELGETLGRNAEDYAEIIASLPMEVDSDVHESFTRQWGKQDPEATAEWLKSLPAGAAGRAATAGLASAWIRYDGDAATTWAASLPVGLARDAAADNICYWLSMKDSQEAWHWADSITDLKTRAGAYQQVATYWRSKVPDAFRAAHDEAQLDVGKPPYQEPKEDENNPFE